MSDIVERLKEPMPRHLFFPLADALCMEAADEITRLRQLLSEAEKREAKAKRIAVNAEAYGYGHGIEAAATLLDKAADKQKSAWDAHIASGSGNAATSHEAVYRSLAGQIRALQSEER